MTAFVKRAVICSAFALLLMFAVSTLSAQEPSGPDADPNPPAPFVRAPKAPVPAAIISAKKVFIANSPADGDLVLTGGRDEAYDRFYAAMKTRGRYEIVSSPSEADLVIEFSTQTTSDVAFGSSFKYPRLVTVIVDPKTRTPLWWFAEEVAANAKQSTRDKNAYSAVNKLVDELTSLAGLAPTADSSAQK